MSGDKIPDTYPHLTGYPPHIEGKLCPVCCGCGLVAHDFYDLRNDYEYSTTAIPQRQTCRACNGRGVL